MSALLQPLNQSSLWYGRSFNESNGVPNIHACVEFLLLFSRRKTHKPLRLQRKAILTVNPVKLIDIAVTTCILGNTDQGKLSASI